MILGIKNIGTFKKKISFVNNIVNECNFNFEEDRLFISEIDVNNENLLFLNFEKKYFSSYQFIEKKSFNINLYNFYRCLKKISIKNNLLLIFSDNNLQILGQTKSKKQIYNIEISLSTNNSSISILRESLLVYNNIIEIHDGLLNNLDLQCFLGFQIKEISFLISNKKLTLNSKNEDIEITKDIKDLKFKKFTNYNIESSFKIKSIYNIFSFFKLFDVKILSMNNNSPLRVELSSEHCQLVLTTSNLNDRKKT